MARTVPGFQETTITDTPVNTTTTGGVSPQLDVGSVPVDLFNHFNIPLTASEKEVSKLKSISDWAKEGTETLGDALLKIKGLEDYLGYSNRLDAFSRIWQYCKMESISKELSKKKEALRRRFNG